MGYCFCSCGTLWYCEITRYLTNTVEQRRSWKANGSLASLEIFCMLRKPMFNYHIYVNRSPVPTLCLLNTIHVPILFLEETIQYYPPIYAQVLQLVFSHHLSTHKP